MPEPYKKIVLPVVIITLALMTSALLWRPAIPPSQGAMEEIKRTALSFESVKLERYGGKVLPAQEFQREYPEARRAVHITSDRASARAEGLLNSIELRLEDGTKRYLFYPGDINYVDPSSGEVVEADPTFAVQPDGTFLMDKASYHVRAPAFSDQPLTFIIDNDHTTFTAMSVGTSTVLHVGGVVDGNRVVYADAFGDGIDYIIQAEADELRKLVVFKKLIEPAEDVRIDFYTSLSADKQIRGDTTEIGAVFFREPTVWDSNNVAEAITIELKEKRLTKIIPRSFFVRTDGVTLTYPVTTDTVNSYYAGAGDGYVYYSKASEASWSTAHDYAGGADSTADSTSNTTLVRVPYDSGGYKTYRTFFPFDTSGISDSEVVVGATLWFTPSSFSVGDNDGDDYLGVVAPTTQASNGHLVAADYDACGDVTPAISYSSTIDISSSLGLNLANPITLNSYGLASVSKTASTTLGLREGHDLLNHSPLGTNTVTIHTSEATGTSNDPYLSVTSDTPTIDSVTTDRTVYATSTEGIRITSTHTAGVSVSSTFIDYVIFMDLDGDGEPDTNERYIQNGCTTWGTWGAGSYTVQKTGFSMSAGTTPNTVECRNTSFPENGKYSIYVKWFDSLPTPQVYDEDKGSATIQRCNQPIEDGSWWDTTLNRRVILQFRSATFSEALFDFPVLVKATSTNSLLDDIESSGDDVRFIDENNGTMLNYEKEFVDATTSVEGYWWVRVPKIATSTDCDYVTLYYDNAATTSRATTTGVWRQDYYEAVWHFGETASATAGTLYKMRDGEASYTGTDDNYMDENAATYNYGSTTPILADESGTSTFDQHILTKFDVSAIPGGCNVTNAYFTAYYTNITADAFDIYEMLQSWVEGYKAGAAPDAGGGATWTNYNGTNAWATAGADGAGDRNSATFGDLNDAGSTNTFATTTFNATGLSVVQGWVNGTNSNEGVWIGPGGGIEADGVAWVANTGATVAQRPKFTVECDGVTGDVYLDSTVNNHDETNSTVASRREKDQSKFGYSPKLAGVAGAGIGIPDSTGFDLTSYTITGWFKRGGTGDPATFSASQTMEPFIAKGYGEADTEAADIQFSVGFNRSGQATLSGNFEDDRHATGNDWAFLGGTTIANSVWRHFGARLKDHAIFNLYLDGFANNTTTYPVNQGASVGGTQKLGIGTTYTTAAVADGGFMGYLDEIRIYKLELPTSTASTTESVWLRAEWYTADNGYVEWGAERANAATITMSSAANQVFVVGQASTEMSVITITEGSTPSITAANDIRIRIPATFNMVFDTDYVQANIGGSDWAKTGAASQGGTVSVTYEDSNRTVVVPVTTNFSANDDITVYGLRFWSFSALSSADNLELETDNAGGTAATDSRTITIVAPTLSSAANQSFSVGQAVTTSSPMTITDATSGTITAANDIRIKIPGGFNMSWDSGKLQCIVAPTLADYSSFYYTNDVPGVTADLSGVTYSSTTDSLFMIINGTPTIYEISLGGSLVRTITMHGFIDTESIDWMYGNMFVVTEERDPYDVIYFPLDQVTTTIGLSEGTILNPTITCVSNACIEGITYDTANDWFYVETEKQADGSNGGRVFKLEMDSTVTEYTTLGTNLLAAGYTDLADIAYDPVTGHLFLLGQENSIIIEATTDGTIIGTRAVDVGIFSQPEGLDFTPNGDSMFIVGEIDDYQRLTRDSKVNNTVTYEDTNKTLVLDVTSDFDAGESITVGQCAFQNFTDASAADNLELEVTNDNGTNDYDDKTITITSATLSVTASSTMINFPAVSYNYSAQTTTAQNPTAGSVYVDGGGGTWTLNLNCSAGGPDCYWYGPGTRSYSFQDGVYPTAGYDGTEDLNIKADGSVTNYDSDTNLCVDYNGDGCQTPATGIHRVLMQWDISSVSGDCTVTSGSITVDNNVTNGDSVHRFGVQALRRNWSEGATDWSRYDGSNGWTTAGAGSTSDDRYATDLMDGNSDSGWGRSALGVLTFDFDADGVSQLQDWINGTVVNNGIIIADNDTSDTNAFIWRQNTYGTAASRPRLTIHCKKNSFRLRGGVVPSGAPSTTGIFCITDPFTCNGTSGCTGVTLSPVGCIGAASTKTVATGSAAPNGYWLKEADWAQGIPGGTTTGIYTTTITWDLQ